MNFFILTLNKIIIYFFSIFILYNSLNLFNYLAEQNSLFMISIQSIHGQLQQQSEIDYIKFQYQSDFINEFKIPIDNNETGLKGITTDSKNNVWFYHNTNTSSTVIEFNPINKTFTKYPIAKETNVDNAIRNSISSEINFIDIAKYLSLSIAIILIGFIIYKRIKNRNTKKNDYLK